MTDQFDDDCGKLRVGDKKPARAAGDESEYEVGYGKPPSNTQFKKGQSGNPKGRRKGGKNMHTIMKDVLEQTVTMKENGQTRRVKYSEAFVRQLAAKALNGTMREQIMMLKAIHDYAPELLKKAELHHSITVTYVLPDGRTEEYYANQDNNDLRSLSAEERPDSCDDEDNSWLN